MSYPLKQSSTARPLLFLMVDNTTHVTGATGLSPTVTLSKNGAAFGAPAGAVTELSGGWYQVAGNATDTGTLGVLLLHATGTGADPSDVQYEVVAYDPQDAVRFGLTALPNAAAEAAGGLYTRGTGAGQINQDANGRVDANAKAWIGGTIPAVNVTGVPKVDLVDWLGSAPDALSSGKLPADLKLWLTTAPLALSSQMVQGIVAAYASGQAPLQPTTAGRTLDVAATGEAGLDFDNVKDATGAHTLTNITVPTTTAVTNRVTANADQIEGSDATDQIRDAILSDATRFPGARIDAAISSRSSHTAADVWTSTTRTLSAAGVQAIWDALTSALTTVGSIGKRLADDVDATISSRLATSGYTAPDNADIVTILARTDVATSTRASATDYTSGRAANLDNLDATVSSRLAASGYTTPPTAATIATAVWDKAASALTTAGSIGKLLVDNVNATISSRSSHTANDVRDAILTDATRFAGANVDAAISSRSSHSAADVWAAATRTLSSGGVQALWDALTSALTTTGSIGKRLADDVDAPISSRLAAGSYTAPDNTDIATILTRTDVATSTRASATDYTTARAAKLDNLDTTVSSRLATSGYTAPDNADIATIVAAVDTEVAAIKAQTDLIPASPAAVGSAMTLDFTQAVPASNTAQTVGDALNAARAQGFGKWVLSGTTLTLYAADGTTTVRAFTLDDADDPTTRT